MNKNMEGFFLEINVCKKKKWLLSCSYNPTKMEISNRFAELRKNADLYLTKYDQFLFLGDFNAGVEDSSVKNIYSSYNLTGMINRPTSFKNPEKPSCVDVILTTCKKSLPKIIDYHSYKYFNNESFREELIQIEANRNNCVESFQNFTFS